MWLDCSYHISRSASPVECGSIRRLHSKAINKCKRWCRWRHGTYLHIWLKLHLRKRHRPPRSPPHTRMVHHRVPPARAQSGVWKSRRAAPAPCNATVFLQNDGNHGAPLRGGGSGGLGLGKLTRNFFAIFAPHYRWRRITAGRTIEASNAAHSDSLILRLPDDLRRICGGS